MPKTVLGHTCPDLEFFQSRVTKEYDDYGDKITLVSKPTYTCIPIINEDGTVEGCDATNDLPIKFCPFCGVKLGEDNAEPS